jgi:hypothetical protein
MSGRATLLTTMLLIPLTPTLSQGERRIGVCGRVDFLWHSSKNPGSHLVWVPKPVRATRLRLSAGTDSER